MLEVFLPFRRFWDLKDRKNKYRTGFVTLWTNWHYAVYNQHTIVSAFWEKNYSA